MKRSWKMAYSECNKKVICICFPYLKLLKKGLSKNRAIGRNETTLQ